jgi:hypothetical protein
MESFNFERRKHPRFPVELPAEYWRINISRSTLCRTGDVSEGGGLLYLPEKIAVGQNIGVKIFTGTDLQSQSIEALGETAWSDSQCRQKDYYHRAGLKFVDISAKNLVQLRDFLNAQMNLQASSAANTFLGLQPTSGIPIENERNRQRRGADPPLEEICSTLEQRQEEIFSAGADGEEDDETELSPELIYEFQEDYSNEQRQNLYHKILDMGIPERQRLAILANREARTLLIRDPNKSISLNVLKNTKINESEVLRYAQRRDLAQDIIVAIAQDPKWKKSYLIKFALVSNPKTPLSVSIAFISNLHERELKFLSRDKNVSPVLRRTAEEILHKKNEK